MLSREGPGKAGDDLQRKLRFFALAGGIVEAAFFVYAVHAVYFCILWRPTASGQRSGRPDQG
eukprot:scaffold1178_cov252-Pinguiococcus_pyrenoidosus.AAC.13